MEASITKACLTEIHQAWASLTPQMRPESVWISQHEPIQADATDTRTSVVRAWLLDANGVDPRSAMDFVRFVAVHSGKNCSSAIHPPPASGVFNNRPGSIHTIGLASFANFQDTPMIYLGYIWGGTFGRGSKYKYWPETETLDCIQNIWLS